MIIKLPDTSSQTISKRLVQVRNDFGVVSMTRVLTLIVSVASANAEKAIEAAVGASHLHPCRVLVLVTGKRSGKSRLDGEIRVGGDAGASEIVVLRLSGPVAGHAASVVTPLLLADSPIVGWWPDQAPADLSADPVGALCSRRISDSARAKDPLAELRTRAKHYRDGDTDLAWTRITRWRALLAAALDEPPFDAVTGVVVTGGVDSSATDLLAAWLAERLRVPVSRARMAAGAGLVSVRLERDGGALDLVRPSATSIATITYPVHPPRRVALRRRDDADCLMEELRRLDPDEVYRAALVKGLAEVSYPRRTATELVNAGEAPSPAESRRVARQISRTSRVNLPQ